jgi:hypothetical protein
LYGRVVFLGKIAWQRQASKMDADETKTSAEAENAGGGKSLKKRIWN